MKGFGGSLRNSLGPDFVFEKQDEHSLRDYKNLSYLMRAILIDILLVMETIKQTFITLVFADEFGKKR